MFIVDKYFRGGGEGRGGERGRGGEGRGAGGGGSAYGLVLAINTTSYWQTPKVGEGGGDSGGKIANSH